MKKMPHITKFVWSVCLLFAFVTIASEADAQRFRAKRKRRKKTKRELTLQDYKYGVGLAMGAGVYSGINGAYNLGNNAYLQGQVGIQILNAALGTSVDYVLEFPDVISKSTVPYAGGGAIVVYGDDYASLLDDSEGDFHFGVRAPLGVYLLLQEFPVKFFGEVVPGFLLAAETVPVLGINLGFRWYFR